MGSPKQTTATVLATFVVVVSMVAIGATAGAVAADGHTRDEAPNYDDAANFTVNFPYTTDHYPGDQNTENGSIEYFSAGSEAFVEEGAEDGVWIDYIIVDADWIDYSACSTDNTKAFGIDRGNNNSGTNIDEDLVEHQINSDFRDDGITVEMYDWSDFANDPPYLAPEDAIIAAQGAGSNSGPCLTVTSEPGWYNIQGFLNGTIANGDCTEEGNPDCEPENKEFSGVNVNSNYLYVCECDSRAEAEEQLGPPPGGDDGGAESTPEPTVTPEPTPTETSENAATPEPTDASGGTSTPDPPDDTPQPTDPPESTTAPTATQSNNGGGGGGGGNSGGGGNTGMTPTSGGGPGFGPVVAILALLGSALLANRRR